MKIPPNMTEQEVINTIIDIAKKVAPKFEFPGWSREDLEQEAFIIAMDGLERYEPDKPLANFLFIHIKNRLGHVKRKHYIRIDKPCLNCPLNAYIKKEEKCTAYERFIDCDIYSKWAARNDKKKNLARPLDIVEYDYADGFNAPEDKLNYKNMITLIDSNISIENRASWLKSKHGIKLSKADRISLKDEIVQIFEEHGLDGLETWEI